VKALAASPFLRGIKHLNLLDVKISGRQISPETRKILEARFGSRVTLTPADVVRKLDGPGN
jgi:hypothetical protein